MMRMGQGLKPALKHQNAYIPHQIQNHVTLRSVHEKSTDYQNRPPSLSNHCSKLEKLKLDGSYDLQSLNNISTVMFPRLEDLMLDDTEVQRTPVRLTPLQIARLIDHHAPVLQELRFMGDYDDHPVMRAWWDTA
jgi:hypothetical protein